MQRLASGSRLWLAVVLGISLPVGGCGKKKLTEIEVPDAGVGLRYDMTAGQAYGGHIRMRNAVQTPVGDLIQAIEFDVDMVVAGPLGDSNLVTATVNGLKLDVRLPEGMPKEAAQQLPSQETVAAVNGTELRFHLSEAGEVTEMPEPPESVAPDLQQVIGMVAGALQSGFVRLPDKSLKSGDTWDPVSADDAGRKGTGTFNGMARDEATGEDIAKLTYVFERSGDAPEGKQGPRVEGKQDIEVLFSVAGYPASIVRKVSGDIQGVGGFNTEVKAEWRKLDKRAVEPPQQETVQEITDPCDPDYVGPEECGPAEPAEGGDAEATEAEGDDAEAADADAAGEAKPDAKADPKPGKKK